MTTDTLFVSGHSEIKHILISVTSVMSRLVSINQLNAQFLYSIMVYILHYNPRHILSNTMLILRRSNCIVTASGIVTLCKWPYSAPFSTGALNGRLQRVTIPDAVTIQFNLLRMSTVLLKTCQRL
jgi:hypothetical protein